MKGSNIARSLCKRAALPHSVKRGEVHPVQSHLVLVWRGLVKASFAPARFISCLLAASRAFVFIARFGVLFPTCISRLSWWRWRSKGESGALTERAAAMLGASGQL